MNNNLVIRFHHIMFVALNIFEVAHCSVTEHANLNQEKSEENVPEEKFKYECTWEPFVMDAKEDSKCRGKCMEYKAFLHAHQNRLICFKFVIPSQVIAMNRIHETGEFDCECGLVTEKARRSPEEPKADCDQKPYRMKALRKWFGNSCTAACWQVIIFVTRFHKETTTLVWCHDSPDVSNYKIVDLNGVITGHTLKLEKRWGRYVNRTKYLCTCGVLAGDEITPSVNMPERISEGNEGVWWLPPKELDLISKMRGKEREKLRENDGPSYQEPTNLTLAIDNHAGSSSRALFYKMQVRELGAVKESNIATSNPICQVRENLSNQNIAHLQEKNNQPSSSNFQDFLPRNFPNYKEKECSNLVPNFDLERPEGSFPIVKRNQKDDLLQSERKKLKKDLCASKSPFLFDKSQKCATRDVPLVHKPTPVTMIRKDEIGVRFDLGKNLGGNKQLRTESGKGTAFKDPIPKMRNTNEDLDIENLRIS